METIEFGQSVAALKIEIDATMAGFFMRRKIAYSPASLAMHGSQDMEQMVRDAHFFGAAVFPNAS